jgi:hypothetical protein
MKWESRGIALALGLFMLVGCAAQGGLSHWLDEQKGTGEALIFQNQEGQMVLNC